MKTEQTKFHIGIHVSDITRSTAFYKDLFDRRPVKMKDDYAKFETDDVVLSLIQDPDRVNPGFGHLGLRVSGDSALKSYFDRMKTSGHDLLKEDHVDCCYAVQDKFWARDPDGIAWEVYTFIRDTDGNNKQDAADEPEAEKAACCAPSCC